jgi:hypothetical protein
MAEPALGAVPDRSPSQPRPSGVTTQPRPGAGRGDPGYSMWAEEGLSGWAVFTGLLLGLVGIFQFITGVVVLAGTGYNAVPARNLVLDAGYPTWGWVHMILGLVMLGTGGGLVFGSTIARVAGVVLAVLSAVVNLAFLPAAPFAATLVIALDVFVIYAITVHGGEPQDAR